MAEFKDVVKAALYLLGRDSLEVEPQELFQLVSGIEGGGSLLETLHELEKEGLLKIDDKLKIEGLGLVEFNKTFANLLDKEPEVALSLLRNLYVLRRGKA